MYVYIYICVCVCVCVYLFIDLSIFRTAYLASILTFLLASLLAFLMASTFAFFLEFLPTYLTSFSHIFWHSIWHLFCNSIWHSMLHSFWYLASILTYPLAWALHSTLKNLELAVKAGQWPLRSGVGSSGQTVPIEIRSSQLGSGNTHRDLELKEKEGRGGKEGRRKEGGKEGRRHATLIKSRGPCLTSGR